MTTTKDIKSLAIECVELTLLPKQAYCAQLTQECDSYGFAFDPQTGQHALASSRIQDFRTAANTLAFLPKGCDVYSESETGGEYLKLTLADAATSSNEHPTNGILDANAIIAAYALRRIILGRSTTDSFETERLVNQLTGYFRAPPSKETASNSTFTHHKRVLIEALIETRLSEKLTVRKLAQACQLSEAYFARTFKNTFKRSPHDYVVERRISKARSELKNNQQSITNIALETGFSSHAHMSYVFQKNLGVSPSSFQR